MVVARITIFGIVTGMFRRINTARRRHVMATLAHTGTFSILVFTLTTGISEIYLTWHSGLRHIPAYKINVCTFCIVRIVLVVFNMGTMTVSTLNILVLGIVAFLAGMTVCTDVQFVILCATYFCPTTISNKNITVTGAQVCKVGRTVNG